MVCPEPEATPPEGAGQGWPDFPSTWSPETGKRSIASAYYSILFKKGMLGAKKYSPPLNFTKP
jgi:hypothetical protein